MSQKFCSKSGNEDKRLFFQKKIAENVLPGYIDCSSELYQKSFNRIEKNKDPFKIRFSSKLFPSMPEKQMWQLCPVFFPRSFSGRVKALLTGTPKTLFAKSYIKSSPNVRKTWVKSEFSIKKIFFLNLIFCSHGIQFRKSCGKLLAKSLTNFFHKIRESKQKIDFSKESRRKRSSGHAGCGSQIYQKSFNQIEKKSIVQFLVFFQNVPLDTEESGVTTLHSVFCSESKLGENLKTVSFNLLFPQNVPLELMNANLTILPISLEVAIKFHIMCGNDKDFNFSHKVQLLTLFHWHVKAVWKLCHKVFAQILKEVTYMKTFKELFFPRSFSGRVKGTFDRLPGTCLCQKLH